MARGDMVDIEMLKLMKRAGFKTISYGLETGSERLMKLIKKKLTTADSRKAIQLTQKAGISAIGSFIIGLPSETRTESFQTIKFAKSLPLDLTRFNLLVPYPGTAVYEMIMNSNHGIKGDWDNFLTVSGFGKDTIPYIPEGRTQKEMRQLQFWANLSFYLRPRQFVKFIRYGFPTQLFLPPLLSWEGVKARVEIALYLISALLRSFVKND